MDDENGVVICKTCGGIEFWAEMRWLHGRCLCRDCYRAAYQIEYGEPYRWKDLDGPKPKATDPLPPRSVSE